MGMNIKFDNSYGRLPARFFTRMAATPVAQPRLIRLNVELARDLGLHPEALSGPEGVAVLAGNHVPQGADPLAQAYAGHQFGGWSPQLGDGRALLLGEIVTPDGRRFDLQLKGSGPTPYSRMGDGRAWLGPVLREYIVSEAMHALGVPTTRALAAVATGETVYRETPLPGAVLTRVASSHIRVGTFQFFAARGDKEALEALCAHVIARHYPQANGALDLLAAVTARQAALVAQWMSLGFIHGVMNTDNAHIAGETIDYGPCAFMDEYDPARVFSSIDRGGRYAYGRQPEMAYWNMAQLATSLLPLMGPDQDAAVSAATKVIEGFAPAFETQWLSRFRAKLGLATAEDGDAALISDFLDRMARAGADFTNSFRALSDAAVAEPFMQSDHLDDWRENWQARLAREAAPEGESAALMNRTNPAIIPRNHRIEAAIAAGVAGDFTPFERLTQALTRPYNPAPDDDDLRRAPAPAEAVTQTFCGT